MNSRRSREVHPIRSFFIRRFFRIAPLFYCAIALYILVDGVGPRYFAPAGIAWWHIALTAGFANGWLPQTINSVVPGDWSIAVEMSFYLLVPWLYNKCRGLSESLVFVLIALIMGHVLTRLVSSVWIAHLPESQQYLVGDFRLLWLFAQLPVFGVGIVVFHVIRNSQRMRSKGLGIVLQATAIVLFIAFLEVTTFRNLFPQHFLYGVAFGVLAVGMYLHPTWLLVNPVTQLIGKISFSMYILHFVVCKLLSASHIVPYTGTGGFLIAYLGVVAVTCIAAVITYHAIEAPGIMLGNRIIVWLDVPRSTRRGNGREQIAN
jgi:peptidoglycan/LPS O-acetylase OafA/YrhL